jgi:peptidyl-prolyl cis-trans isomerase D
MWRGHGIARPQELGSMSSTIKQFFVMAAVLAIVFVFIIQFRPGTDVKGKSGPQCMAEVRGTCIPEPDYVAAYRLAVPSHADGDAIKAMRLQKTVVDGLIERWLLVQDAQRLGLSVSDDDLTRQLG